MDEKIEYVVKKGLLGAGAGVGVAIALRLIARTEAPRGFTVEVGE